jgi:hypothetical protein
MNLPHSSYICVTVFVLMFLFPCTSTYKLTNSNEIKYEYMPLEDTRNYDDQQRNLKNTRNWGWNEITNSYV